VIRSPGPMKFEELKISGVWAIDPEPFVDERGMLRRHFCAREFAARGLATNIAQCNISENTHRHTLRGFHYQEPPHGEAKTVSVVRGSLRAVIADIRPESPTYLKWVAEELSATNRRALQVPPGCAMAFLTLEDDTALHYYMSEFFSPESYRGIRYDDPAFGFRWPAEPRVVSEKDRAYPDFNPARG
jgi:dTDP-4-dehydrorhamnose 3,5-epimerase